VRVWESKLASFGFMGVKFWLQNLHAQFTERSVPVIFSSMVTMAFTADLRDCSYKNIFSKSREKLKLD
jgi:hypothetical protein